jgi:hypothetical protein
MTTTVAPPGPPPVEGAQWNGERWFTYNAATNAWDIVPEAPTTPPLPATGNNGSGTDKPKPQMVMGTLGDYFDQQASQGGSGKTWKFHQRPVGTSYRGIVASDISVRVVAQTDGDGNVVEQNGQKKYQLLVPMLVMPEGEYTDGHATAVFKAGDGRDKLNAAMAAVGAPLTTDEATGRAGYVPQPGAFIQMTKVAEQQGKTAKGEGFTKYIYEVHYRNPDDPNITAIRAEIEGAVAAVEDAPPPPEMKYDPATRQWVMVQPAASAGPPAPIAPPLPPAATAPAVPPPTPAPPAPAPPAPPSPTVPPATPTSPAVPPPSAPPVAAPPPAHTAQATQAAAAHVVTADGSAPATTNGVPAAAPPAPQITREQWAQMQPAVRAVVAERTGVAIPDDLNPAHAAFAGK